MSTPERLVPLRAEDALFLYAQTPYLCQQVGAVLFLEPAPVGIGGLRAALRQRVPQVAELCTRLREPLRRWERPRWILDDDVDVADRVREVTLGRAGAPGTVADAVNGFFSAHCDLARRPWEVLLVRGAPDGRPVIAVKVHHAVGDSQVIIAALTRLFDPADRAPAQRGDTAASRAPAAGPEGPAARARAAGRAARGLWHLAAAGRAPEVSVCGPFTGSARRYVPVALPARQAAVTARALRAGVADLLLAVIAEALGRLLCSRGEQTERRVVRVAVPRARAGQARRLAQPWGNRSAAISLDVPVGPMPPAERLATVRGQVALHLARGEEDGAALVLRALNLLPVPLQRRVAALVYHRRWFNLLVSVFPGVRHPNRLLGARVEEVYPVLPLADGVGLAIGAMTWERSLSIGILADAVLVPDADKFAAEVADAFRDYEAAAGGPGAAPGRQPPEFLSRRDMKIGVAPRYPGSALGQRRP